MTHFALTMIFKQLQRVWPLNRPRLQECTFYHRRVYGLPSAHELLAFIAERRPIPLSAIDWQWHLRPPMRPAAPSSSPAIDAPSAVPTLVVPTAAASPMPAAPAAASPMPAAPAAPQAIHDPVPAITRGRPSQRVRNATSTRRDPSAFERAERRVITCSQCRQTGHNSRGCRNEASTTN